MDVAQIRALHKADIKKSSEDDEALQARYYARPLSYPLAWFFIKLKWTANQITALALVMGLAGCVFLALQDYLLAIVGITLLQVRHLLDYADGTLARAMGTASNFGKWFDRTADEILDVVMPVCLGIGLYPDYGLWAIVLGFVYALCHALSALSLIHIELIYKTPPHSFYKPNPSLWGLLYQTGINLQSAAVLILLPFVLFKATLYYLVFYTLLTFCEMALGMFIRVIKREGV